MLHLISEQDLPKRPSSKKELLSRVPSLYGNKYNILEKCGKGTGAPGIMTEMLLGSEGKNNTFGDCVGIELKWKSVKSKSYLTMFHLEVDANGADTRNSSLIPVLREYGYPGKKDKLVSFRHTVSDRSNKFDIEINKGTDGLRLVYRTMGGEEVYWSENDLLNGATKLKNLILVAGSASKDSAGNRYVSINSASYLTKFRTNHFLSLIRDRIIVVDFDFREAHCGEMLKDNPVLRNHGTKFRIKMENLPKLWDSIEPII